jgi:nucleoside 2-deoxyribosyltransferase
MSQRIYLAGPINKCTDAEAKDWRREATELLGEGWTIVDPMRRDYRGHELACAPQIVYGDLRDINSCDVLLVNACRPSWGTAMEIYHAFNTRRILVICWIGLEQHPSPWLRMHAHLLAPHLKEAIDFINLP